MTKSYCLCLGFCIGCLLVLFLEFFNPRVVIIDWKEDGTKMVRVWQRGNKIYELTEIEYKIPIHGQD